MKPLFLPYEDRRDPSTADYVLVGRDRRGKEFGVGSGSSREVAEQRLREWVLDSLLASAADGHDGTSDLATVAPKRMAIELTPLELIPIRLRLLRVGQGLSQLEVASRLGMTQQGYAKLERPGANLQLRTVMSVEAVLERELLQLAGRLKTPAHRPLHSGGRR
jgi:DNA-binding XRE family transcriptional regulator